MRSWTWHHCISAAVATFRGSPKTERSRYQDCIFFQHVECYPSPDVWLKPDYNVAPSYKLQASRVISILIEDVDIITRNLWKLSPISLHGHNYGSETTGRGWRQMLQGAGEVPCTEKNARRTVHYLHVLSERTICMCSWPPASSTVVAACEFTVHHRIRSSAFMAVLSARIGGDDDGALGLGVGFLWRAPANKGNRGDAHSRREYITLSERNDLVNQHPSESHPTHIPQPLLHLRIRSNGRPRHQDPQEPRIRVQRV